MQDVALVMAQTEATSDDGSRQQTSAAPADVAGSSKVRKRRFDGLVELYGYHDTSQSWLVTGWLADFSAPRSEACTATVVFERGSITEQVNLVYFERIDLHAGGAGFVLTLASPDRRLGHLLRLEITVGEQRLEVPKANEIRAFPEAALVEHFERLLGVRLEQPGMQTLRAVLALRQRGEGFIDVYGAHPASGGFFVCGWISNEWIDAAGELIDATASFDNGSLRAPATICFHFRQDIEGRGLGFVLHFTSAEPKFRRLASLRLHSQGNVVPLRLSTQSQPLSPKKVGVQVSNLLAESDSGAGRDALRDLITKAEYNGEDTIRGLSDDLFFEVDNTIVCEPDSVILCGWMLARPDTVRAIRLRVGNDTFSLDMINNVVWFDRPDVIESVGARHGFDDSRCGFVARVPIARRVSGMLIVELETCSGDIGLRKMTPSQTSGIGAIKRMLSLFDMQFLDLGSLYDRTLGPAIHALNQASLAASVRFHSHQFGRPVYNPKFSLVIPLYGRIDFLEIQLGFFAVLGLSSPTEIIYVLDDPGKVRQTCQLAESSFERFRVPFRLLCLERNIGFARASNVGLANASANFVCFLNSDVFPQTSDWLDRLAGSLEADPALGVIGPLLLFEDGSIQHEGLSFKKLPQFDNWYFTQHRRKGLKPAKTSGVAKEIGITGACMLMRREDASRVGGFDEDFIVGDFEDTDLCFRLSQIGLGSAVDHEVSLYHLERKSQASSANLWRVNLTLYNAWLHQRRWASLIDQLMLPLIDATK